MSKEGEHWRNVIIDSEQDGNKILVGIEFNVKQKDSIISRVRSIFAKRDSGWVNWINDGKMVYEDSEKLKAFISQQQTNPADLKSKGFDSINNVLQENPDVKHYFAKDEKNTTLSERERIARVEETSRTLLDSVQGVVARTLSAMGITDARIQRLVDAIVEHPETIVDREGEVHEQASQREEALARDEAAFAQEVDNYKNKPNSYVADVMTTPLVFKLAGADLLPVKMTKGDFVHILEGEHSEDISAEILKQIPRALTDPVMIFDSTTKGSLVALLDLKDNNGTNIIVPLALNQTIRDGKNIYTINRLTNAYGKEKYGWYKQWVLDGNLRYYNREKTAIFARQDRLQLPPRILGKDSLFMDRIKTDADFVKLSKQKGYESYYQSAFHGSPHQFEKFCLDHIGTGEGAQVHGYGFYFTSKEATAMKYRGLAESVATLNGKSLADLSSEYEDVAARTNNTKERDLSYEKASMLADTDLSWSTDSVLTDAEEMYSPEAIAWYKESVVGKVDIPGSLVQVDIPEDNVMLNEQLPFSEQPSEVVKAFRDALNDGKLDSMELSRESLQEFEDTDGFGLRRAIEHDLGSPEAASKWLNDIGIKDIKYDGRQDGECYVVFDDNALNIIETYNQMSKGRITFTDMQTLIEYFEGADPSTSVHEVAGHLYLKATRLSPSRTHRPFPVEYIAFKKPNPKSTTNQNTNMIVSSYSSSTLSSRASLILTTTRSCLSGCA